MPSMLSGTQVAICVYAMQQVVYFRSAPNSKITAADRLPNRPRPNNRESAYVEIPAINRCTNTNVLNAATAGSALNKSMAGTYIQPDCGSPANGMPEKIEGSQPGISPCRKLKPRCE